MYKPVILTALVCIIFFNSSCNKNKKTTPESTVTAIKFDLPDGFSLEQIYHPSENDQRSWVALAQAPNNIIYASGQRGKLYYFNTPEANKTLSKKDIIFVNLEIGSH